MPDILPDPATDPTLAAERVLILDFGSQVTQLIARRLRESGVYCEIWPFNADPARIAAWQPRGIILSGGPASVHEAASPLAPAGGVRRRRPDPRHLLRRADCCAQQLGGEVQGSDHREFGRAFVEVVGRLRAVPRRVGEGRARAGVDEPRRPRHRACRPASAWWAPATARPSPPSPTMRAAIYGVQFHPEVVHTPHGAALLRNFTHGVLGLSGDWTMAAFRSTEIARIRAQVGAGRVICGLSGGVDSSVAAVLIHEAIGDQLTCIFVDHGLLRQGEAEEVVDASSATTSTSAWCIATRRTCSWTRSTASPIRRRSARRSAGCSSTCSRRRRTKLGGADFLAQGTLYPDVIESVSFTGGPSVTIKSHHNVGGLPERMHMKLVEPLRELFKDEVRALGRELGLPGQHRRPPSVSRARAWRSASPARSRGRSSALLRKADAIYPGGDPQRRPLRRDLAGLRGAAAGAHRRRDGRRPHLRPRLRAARGDLDRRHDRGRLSVRRRLPGARRHPHHQRGARASTGCLRRHQQAARHDRVGMIMAHPRVSRNYRQNPT